MRVLKFSQIPAWARMSAAFLGAGLCVSQPSLGDVTDNPNFDISGLVVVWGADSANGTPIVSDLIFEQGAVANDLITGDVHTVVTGTLDALDESFSDGTGATLRIQRVQGGPNQDTRQGDRFTTADDVLNPFGLRANTDVRTIRSDILSSFYVASNKAFNIDVGASSAGDPADLNLIRLRMRMTQSSTDDGLSFGTAAQLPHTGNTNRSGVQWGGYRRLSNLTTNRDIFRGNRKTAASEGSIADVEAEVVYTVYIP